MIKQLLFLVIFCFFTFSQSTDAQIVELKSGTLNLQNTIPNPISESNKEAVFNNHFYGLYHAKGENKINPLHITAWLNSEIALIHMPLTLAEGKKNLYPFPSSLKIDPIVLDSIQPNSKIQLSINLYQYNDAIANILTSFGTIGSYNGLNKSLHIQLNTDSVQALMSYPFVFWAEFPAPKLEVHNLRERTNHRVPLIQNLTGPFQLTGKGVVMGEWDGRGADDHIDYEYRLNVIDAFVNNNGGRHATHVAGTMLGGGIQNPAAKGMAPEATFYSYDFFGNVTAEMDSAARKYKIELTQNSYGYSPSFDRCNTRGTYDNTSVSLDRLVNKYPNLLHVFSAGNSRSSNCLGGGYGTVGSGFQSSKNSLAVGAVRFTDANSWFSSYGPVRDGRLKPEITAVGVDVYSTFPNNTYRGGYNGTSMSCPGTSGTAALITQLYKEKFDTVPDAHLIKGILCNGADDLGRSGPDFQYGFGRLNGFVAANILNDTFFRVDTVAQGTVISDTIFIDNPHLFKVMLCYTDIEASSGANKTLINDLDLFLVDDAGDTLLPWTLNPSSPTAVASRGKDTLNNIEQVTLETPTSDYYIYHVKGTSIANGNQIFSVNWLEQDTSLTIVYPNGGEKWVPPINNSTRQTIRWDAHGISGTGTLSYSIDSGTSWTNISTAVNLDLGYYIWQNCPSTVITSNALIKVQQGSFVDSSDAVFDIFQEGPLATAVPCSEQLHITWNAIDSAIGYHVYMNDSGKMKNMGYTSETFFTIKGLADTSSYWVAIAPVAENGAEGPRGWARRFTPNANILTPTFTSTPMDSSVCSGSGVSFSSSVTGTSSITRSWEVSRDSGETWQAIASSNNDVLTLSTTYASDDSSLYRMTAVNACLSVETSDWGMLLVDSALPFGYVDTSINICIGQDSIFELVQNENSRNLADWYFKATPTSTPVLLASDTFTYWNVRNVQTSDRGEYYARLKNICGTQSNTITIELDVNDPLQLSLSGEDTICFGQTATNMAIATGGRPANYEYFWQMDTFIINAANLVRAHDSAETWRAGVFDYCSADTVYDSKTISVRSLPKVTLPEDTTICKGTSIEIAAMASGGNSSTYHYLWSNNLPDSAMVLVNPATTTTYTLILTDSCSTPTDTAEITVRVLDALDVSIVSSKDTLCNDETHQLSVTGLGGDTANYTFTWDDGSTHLTRTISAPRDTTFYVQLTDNCSTEPGKDSFHMIIRAPLEVTILGADTLCNNEALSLKAVPQGGDADNYQFVWDDGSTNPDRAISSANDTAYSVVLTDNCTVLSAKDSINIIVRPPLSIAISGKDTLCTDELQTITATASGGKADDYMLLWDDGSTSASRTIFTNSDTVFSIVLTDNCTVAPANDSFEIAVRPPLEISILGPDTLCLGEKVTFRASPLGGLSSSYVFDWSNANTDQIEVTGYRDTVISLELSDGCTPQSANTQRQIIVREGLSLEPISDQRLCSNSEATINLKGIGGNPGSYQYFVNGQAQASPVVKRTLTDSTLLFFQLTDNCSATDAFDTMLVDIRPINPIIFAVEQENLLVKAKTVNDGKENWWGTNSTDLSQFGDSTAELSYPNFGPAQLCLKKIDDAGCSETFCRDLEIFDVFKTKDINVSIYPNPANKEVNVSLDKVAGNVEVNLISVDAKYIWRNQFSTFDQTLFTFDVTQLASSVYILEIIVNGEIIRERIVVQ
jgi:hypothetical protein